jgi:hypothetical protein
MAHLARLPWPGHRREPSGVGSPFDPDKLRTLYLAYEAKQGAAGEAYARIEKSYDTSYRLTLEKIAPSRSNARSRSSLNGISSATSAPISPRPRLRSLANPGSVARQTPRTNPSTATNFGGKRKVSPNPGSQESAEGGARSTKKGGCGNYIPDADRILRNARTTGIYLARMAATDRPARAPTGTLIWN